MEEEYDDELFEHHSFTAEKGLKLVRVDKFLMDRLENSTRTKIQENVTNGRVFVNGATVKSNYKVKPLDVVSIMMPHPPRDIELHPENIPLEILFEDEHFVIINKPAGLVVHPGYGNYTGTLVNGLIYHFTNLPNSCDLAYRPGLVHRLDKNTSGVMVIAKSELAMLDLAKQFFDRTIDRRYNALVWGVPKDTEGTIKTNLARSLKNRKQVGVFEYEGEIGKHAITHYKLLRDMQYVSIVECKLETGRTHQIRVHMQHIQHPVFNDIEYGGDKIIKGLPTANYKRFIENCFELIPGQALHARTLELTHPATGERMRFEKELPEGFQAIIERFEKAQLSV
jgi:23S rRNA pseudouridine1911/1915/1917 synthase